MIEWIIKLLALIICPWDFSGKNIGVGCHLLLQGIFPTQASKLCLLCLLHYRQILLPTETSGKPCTQLQIIYCCLAIYLLLLIASSFLSVSLYLPAALSLFPLYLLLLLSPYYNSKHNKEPHHGSRFRQKTTALASSFSFSRLRMIETSYC